MTEECGRYRLLEEVARGAHGIVHRALDLELDRVVALKMLRGEDAGPAARERFLREARLAARLRHPNVVPVIETGEHEGRPFYVMPFLEGEPLRGPLPPAEACRLMARVADAVAFAHSQGVIHRDLKPSNILVCSGEPVVTDFGVARGEGDVRVTGTGELVGTPAYMSPEQVLGGGKDADGKSDVYALGLLLFELLMGRPAFEAETFVELSARVLNDPAPGLPGYDPALAALVQRCLAKEPEARPDAAELARRLERWAPRRPARWGFPIAVVSLATAGLWIAASPVARPVASARGDMARVAGGRYEIGDPRIGRRAVELREFWIDLREAPGRASGFSYVEALSFCLRQGKRLPTEEEWEAATGGRLFPWGEEPDPSRASCRGARGPNRRDAGPSGAQDMAGNLAEWTATPGRLGPEFRVVRGGHWQASLEQCTSYARQEVAFTRRLPTLGFRCASSVELPVLEKSGGPRR